MIVNGSYHKFFILTEQLHLLRDIVSFDILTTMNLLYSLSKDKPGKLNVI